MNKNNPRITHGWYGRLSTTNKKGDESISVPVTAYALHSFDKLNNPMKPEEGFTTFKVPLLYSIVDTFDRVNAIRATFSLGNQLEWVELAAYNQQPLYGSKDKVITKGYKFTVAKHYITMLRHSHFIIMNEQLTTINHESDYAYLLVIPGEDEIRAVGLRVKAALKVWIEDDPKWLNWCYQTGFANHLIEKVECKGVTVYAIKLISRWNDLVSEAVSSGVLSIAEVQ